MPSLVSDGGHHGSAAEQSSGKLTLMNHLLKMRFAEMDACVQGVEPDDAGSVVGVGGGDPSVHIGDGLGWYRWEGAGEDDTVHHSRSRSCCLRCWRCTSDMHCIVLMNMWCHDIGGSRASGQQALAQDCLAGHDATLFTPRKTTLMFIIIDMENQDAHANLRS